MDDPVFIDDIKQLLLRHEGLKLSLYQDTQGKTSIGVGRNLSDRGISAQEAMMLLSNDINLVIAQCQNQFGWFDGLSNNRKMVVLDMCFNMGIAKFSEFKQTIEYIGTGDYEKASVEMLNSFWAKQVGARATELSEMMKQG